MAVISGQQIFVDTVRLPDAQDLIGQLPSNQV